ncbi:MAG: ABC transporter permease [Oscillospiraceae bacterium]|nr:ABC transporter permease [Oscillospiraceae bacterium]
MRKNIYIKSMLRQPVRSLLLVLLIAVASFAFTMRAAEYIVVSERISELSEFFQSVGVLSHREGITADVSEAIDLIAESPYVAAYDRRRGFEGTLVDMHNAYIQGSRYWRASWAYRHIPDEYFVREYVNLMPRLWAGPEFAGFVSGDSFFYGELLDVQHIPRGWTTLGFYPHKLLYVQVDEVLEGYPDRLFERQELILRIDFPEEWESGSPPDEWDSPLAEMEIGQRYFFKGTFYFMLGGLQSDSRTITKYIKPIDGDALWYIPVAPGETVDTAALGIDRQLEFTRHVQSAVYLRTTRDMALMPAAQESESLIRLREGRFIDREDYLYARPVVVIEQQFARRRQVGIGDTITVNVNADQHLVYSPYYVLGNICYRDPFPVPIVTLPELGILSMPGADPTMTLELEVVGIYDLLRWRLISTDWSSADKFMYIPDSLLPDDWGLQSAHFGEIGSDYTPAVWYSFVLHNSRDEGAFLWELRDALGEMGLRVSFVGQDGSGFWPVADVIFLSITLNLIIFSVVLVLVLALTMALFIWQRKKEYAILRSLGCSAKKISVQSTIALMLFGLPALVAGGTAGWFFAVRMAGDAIAGFGEMIADTGQHLLTSEREAMIAYYTEAALLPISHLVGLCAMILAAMLVFHTIGNLRMARMSILEILQGAQR